MNLKPLLFILLPATLSAHAQHGVHEHGFGQLNLVLSQQQLVLELHSPAADIVGFEHNPATGEEQAAYDQALQKAQHAAALFTLPASAGCELQQTRHIEQEDHEHGEHQHEEHDHEHGHTDIQLHYSWQCSQPDALNALDASGLFTQFPSFHRIELQGIVPAGQIAATLTAQQPGASW
ncbi:DUF2796 domain-containing protein [Oceanimonas sp. CAM02]|uniref:DUF2796 domain-containing protein n=1 Tax=Oceanimonas sp. CAM02 TaxID=3080336 RepID=UPI0029354838|nr:DUF2796 domain-containing protein [Oceanimonas sp. CAM02]MDV2858529.1 DUF2796 domain-containing protein [Oceanimonas sp. CAM02]